MDKEAKQPNHPPNRTVHTQITNQTERERQGKEERVVEEDEIARRRVGEKEETKGREKGKKIIITSEGEKKHKQK